MSHEKRLVLLAVLTLSLPSWADAPGKEPCKDGVCPPPRRICLNVFCTYHDKDQGDGSGKELCQAGAVFQKKVTHDGQEIRDDSREPYDPVLEVSCREHPIYAGSAHRFTDHLGTRIQALSGPYPSVVLPRGALREGHRYEPSVLELGGGETLRGYCFVYTGQPLL